jgi:hypothetical protein
MIEVGDLHLAPPEHQRVEDCALVRPEVYVLSVPGNGDTTTQNPDLDMVLSPPSPHGEATLLEP